MTGIVTGMRSSVKIEQPHLQYGGMRGWPRPYYEDTVEADASGATTTVRRFVQYLSGIPSHQIFDCDPDRTYEINEHFLCTSCGLPLADMPDACGWLIDGTKARHDEPIHGMTMGSKHTMKEDFSFVASGMCTRCCVFAMRACPFFSELIRVHGDQHAMFYPIRSPEDYGGLCEDGGIVDLAPHVLQREQAHTLVQLKSALREQAHAWSSIG